ncbi:ribonuclease HII [Pseudomonadota bacterium]
MDMRPTLTAGVDEAGRGPLAGPVVVAAVILDPDRPIAGLDDSKKLSATRREALFDRIRQESLAWSVIQISPGQIDDLNILQATLLGMQQAVERLIPTPELALIDGNRAPRLPCQVRTLVGGDGLEPAISAASILAKVTRDRIMVDLHRLYPRYGFDRHKGYPTRDHLQRLAQFGPCEVHRRSFAPVRDAMQKGLL